MSQLQTFYDDLFNVEYFITKLMLQTQIILSDDVHVSRSNQQLIKQRLYINIL